MPDSNVRAIQLTEQNLDHVISLAEEIGFNLSYLRDNMVLAAGEGYKTYLVMGGSTDAFNVTFTEFREDDFAHLWKFVTHESSFEFTPVERV